MQSLRNAFSASGFAFANVSVPWNERFSDVLAGSTVDDEVEELHDAMRAANLSLPPVAVAPAHHAVFIQKYLESYPVSALLALAPFPPSPRGLLHRWAEGSSGGGGRRAEAAALTATQLREAITQRLGPSAHLASDMHLLQLLSLDSNAVNLEPEPVPMLVVSPPPHLLTGSKQGPGSAALYRAEDVVATLQQHELDTDDEQQVHWLSSCGTTDDAAEAVRVLWGEGLASEPAGLAQGVVDEVTEKLVDWVQARY